MKLSFFFEKLVVCEGATKTLDLGVRKQTYTLDQRNMRS